MPVQLRELLTKRSEGTKDLNRLNLLRAIMAKPGSQTELSLRSGLSGATVSDAVGELKGIVKSERMGHANIIGMVETPGAAVGIELGFRYSAIVARRVDQRYDEARVRTGSRGAAAGSKLWLEDIVYNVREAVRELGEDEIVSIGLAVPRMVNPHVGSLVSPALPPWNEGDNPAELLAGRLRAETNGPTLVAPKVVLDNDANLAAYAESIYEFGNAETLVGIKASTGIGAGIVVAGRIFRGGLGMAGEIGHVVVDPDGKFCACGGRGCLETQIGADALVEQAKIVLGHENLESPRTLEDLVHMAGEGNLTCQRVLREAASTLGFAIGNLCNILNPNVVVLSGAFGRPDAAKFTVEACQEAIRKSAMRAAVGTGFKIKPAEMKHPAAHGALVVGLEGTEYKSARGAVPRVRSPRKSASDRR